MNEKITPELMKQAETAGSPEEIQALAKEHGIELTPEDAQAYYDRFHKTGELADDELDAVAGGGCHRSDGKLMVSAAHSCQHFKCKECGHKAEPGEKNHEWGAWIHASNCYSCKWATQGGTVCNNPANMVGQ